MKTLIKILARRKFLLFAVIVSLLFAFIQPIFANIGTPGLESWQKSIFGPGYDKRGFDKNAFDNFEHSVAISITGCFDKHPLTGEPLTCPPNERGGAIGTTTTLIASLYNPPASGVEYLAYVGKNLGIVQPAYAQTGTGFQGLVPILEIWRVFRNIAYLGFIVVFVVTGLAIMFRVRLSPQSIITIQSALPRIVIALLLVTFSYAIAGLLIDLSYVLFLLLVGAMENMDGITANEAVGMRHDYLQGGFLETMGIIIGRGMGAIRDILGGISPIF